MFRHAYINKNEYKIIGLDGRTYTPDNAGYKNFIKGNVPAKISGDRFVSIVGGEVIVSPDKESVLDKENRRSILEGKVAQEIRSIARKSAINSLFRRKEITADEREELLK